jgi:hypothetical protein
MLRALKFFNAFRIIRMVSFAAVRAGARDRVLASAFDANPVGMFDLAYGGLFRVLLFGRSSAGQ